MGLSPSRCAAKAHTSSYSQEAQLQPENHQEEFFESGLRLGVGLPVAGSWAQGGEAQAAHPAPGPPDVPAAG
jgi:hypothetical protein